MKNYKSSHFTSKLHVIFYVSLSANLVALILRLVGALFANLAPLPLTPLLARLHSKKVLISPVSSKSLLLGGTVLEILAGRLSCVI